MVEDFTQAFLILCFFVYECVYVCVHVCLCVLLLFLTVSGWRPGLRFSPAVTADPDEITM